MLEGKEFIEIINDVLNNNYKDNLGQTGNCSVCYYRINEECVFYENSWWMICANCFSELKRMLDRIKDEGKQATIKEVEKVIDDSVHYYEAIANKAWLKWNIRRLILGLKEPEPKELKKEREMN